MFLKAATMKSLPRRRFVTGKQHFPNDSWSSAAWDEIKAFTFDSGRQNESGRQISMVKLTWNAEKQVMLRSTQSAEKHVLLWHYHAYFFWWKWKCWEAGHAEKHKICWKACFVVKCLFFLRKWWNLNAEKQVMLRSTQSAKKHVLLWHYHAYFFYGNGET